jgi:DNA-binding response OmpR family regulator
MRLLLVEDDPSLGNGLVAGLRQHGFTPDLAISAAAARQCLQQQEYSALVLDLGLPGEDGLSLLTSLRRDPGPLRHLPVLILTARDNIEDRIAGLDAGADDYLTKPFDLGEVAAHLRALLRRIGGHSTALIKHADLVFDSAARQVSRDGVPVELSARELEVLELLLLNCGRVLTKAQIEAHLYRWSNDIGSNTVEVFVSHLRRKLRPDLIRTLRGIGYTIDRPDGAR